jgi:tetratricopeptide (TPR) repeat protein
MSEKQGAQTSSPPANITELELAFAHDPTSDAFLPLCEAYLSQGRLMEAMVLGKKAVKARPEDKTRRLLLARVFSEQGKLPKAVEEVQALLRVEVLKRDPSIHVALGKLLDRAGNATDAVAAFKAAIDADSTHEEARAALKAKGIEYAQPPADSGAPPLPSAPLLNATPAAQPASGQIPSASGVPSAAAPRQPPRRPRRTAPLTEEELGIVSHEPPKSGAKGTLWVIFGGLAALMCLVIGMSFHRVRVEKLTTVIRPARENVQKDSLSSLRRALRGFEDALETSRTEPIAVSHVAYIKAVMFAQYGVGDSKELTEAAVTRAEQDAQEISITHVARAMLMTKGGNAEGAANLLKDKSLELGSSSNIETALGDAYVALRRFDDAGAAYQRARELSAKDARALWASGEFMRMVGRERDAMSYFDSTLRIDSEHVPARLARALVRLESGGPQDLVAAQTDLTRMSEHQDIGPYYGAVMRVAYAELQRRQGVGNPAKELEDAKAKLGAHPDLLMAQARLELGGGRTEEGVKILKQVVKQYPARLSAHLALIRGYMDAGQFAEAETAVETAQQQTGKANLELAILRGVTKREKRDFRAAEDALRKAFEIAKDHPRIQLELARVYSQEKRFPEAIKLLQSAIDGADGESPVFVAEVFTQTASTLLEQGSTELAAGAADEAIKKDPGYAPAYYFKGLAQKAAKASDAGQAALATYLEKAPKGEYAAKAREAMR